MSKYELVSVAIHVKQIIYERKSSIFRVSNFRESKALILFAWIYFCESLELTTQ